MTAKEFIHSQCVRAGDSVFDAAAKIPIGKLSWKPLDEGRSALELAQECAYCPLWCVDTLNTRAFDMSKMEEFSKHYAESIKDWNTVEACRAAFHKNLSIFSEAMSAFPDPDMDQTIDLPWGNFTFAGIMFVPAWNCYYHLGQVNYIQTLYGDKSM